MIDLGVATSIAIDNQYSWQDTVDFAKKNRLNTIQFYIPENIKIPQISNLPLFKNCYLHFPNDYDSTLERCLSFSNDFKKMYNSEKIIIHQKEDLTFNESKIIIECINQNDLFVGLENEGQTDLFSYFNLLEYLSKSVNKMFAVIDIHRFYNNYNSNYNNEEIIEMIFKLLEFCQSLDLKIILHIIDSKSFKNNRNDWVPIFEGIIPYSRLLNFIYNKKINIESIVFEYESLADVKNSLENMKKIDYNIAKY